MTARKEDMTRSIKLPQTINIALRNIKDAKVSSSLLVLQWAVSRRYLYFCLKTMPCPSDDILLS
jgi:hypothetical protein